jgi:hypothetical protein
MPVDCFPLAVAFVCLQTTKEIMKKEKNGIFLIKSKTYLHFSFKIYQLQLKMSFELLQS